MTEFRTCSLETKDNRIGIVRNKYESEGETYVVLAWFERGTSHTMTQLQNQTVEVSPEELVELASIGAAFTNGDG